MDERTERMLLLERIAFTSKIHPSHLPSESVDHWIARLLRMEIRISITNQYRH